VEQEYLDDDFNLTGLSGVVPFYTQALAMVQNAEPGAFAKILRALSMLLARSAISFSTLTRC
jgi:hypothetical protein